MMRTSRYLSLLAAAITFVGASSVANGQPALQLRVLTYNIHHGEGTDGVLDLERTAAVIRSSRPDLVALQEVDRRARRSRTVDQPAELAHLTGMCVAFQKNIDFQGGDYGNAILSRFPICQQLDLKLPSHHEGEQRGALAVQVAPRGRPLWLVCTHFDHRRDESERLASAEKLRGWLAGRGTAPVILAGDLNAYRQSATLAALEADWHHLSGDELPTFPTAEPKRQIDYVLVRPATAWRARHFKVLDAPTASDHRPLLVVLELLAPQ